MQPTSAQITNALYLLFSHIPPAERINDINALDSAMLKEAYRNRAKAFHPDRAKILGVEEEKLHLLFHKLGEAFSMLTPIVDRKEKIKIFGQNTPTWRTKTTQTKGYKTQETKAQTKSARPNFSSKTQRPQDKSHFNSRKKENIHRKRTKKFYNGRIPNRKLRFAQFLYYNKIIDWQTLIDSLNWQFSNRPKFGEIGVAYGFFKYEDIFSIIKNSLFSEQFGSTAMRLGLINAYRLYVILGKQKRLNYPIGRFFVEQRIIRSHEGKQLLEKMWTHNLKF